jgi:hypothetical protein
VLPTSVGLASFDNWRDSRGTRGNAKRGRGFWRFVRLGAAECGRLRSRISRRTLTGSPAPIRTSHRTQFAVGRGEWRSGSESRAGAGGELSGVSCER